MAGAKTMAERVAALETWKDDHDDLCERREIGLGREIKEMKGDLRGMKKGAWAVALALLAFAFSQLYGKLDRPALRSEITSAALAAVPPR